MNKSQLIEAVWLRQRAGLAHRKLNQSDVRQITEAIFEIIAETLESGEGVTVAGFGRFLLHERKGQVVKHPTNGEVYTTPARPRVKFRASPLLSVRVLGGEGRG